MKTVFLLSLVCWAQIGLAEPPQKSCQGLRDNAQRLACYDRLFQTQSSSPSQENTAAESASRPAVEESLTASQLSSIWELDERDKRGTFVLRTYQPNLLLPLHLTSNINKSPTSPTHPASDVNHNYQRNEAKLQISLRTKVAEELLLPGGDLWLAYTQQSLMQAWDSADSSPFRSTDYQPEAIYIVPIPKNLGTLPAGWNARLLQLGIAHQSNGQSDPLSRSWNRLYFGVGLERGAMGLQLRANQRLKMQNKDDNPDLMDHIGPLEVALNWTVASSQFSLNWRGSLKTQPRGSLRLDWSRPVFAEKPLGLRWYVQLFSGYGETLLDYNHRQTSLGLGLALFQF